MTRSVTKSIIFLRHRNGSNIVGEIVMHQDPLVLKNAYKVNNQGDLVPFEFLFETLSIPVSAIDYIIEPVPPNVLKNYVKEVSK